MSYLIILSAIASPVGSVVAFLSLERPSSGIWEPRMSRTLILLGLILVAVGLLWRWIGVLRLGRLPGDIVVQHQNFTFYFPVATGLLISVVLTLILWLAGR
jgi:hypothetical protein